MELMDNQKTTARDRLADLAVTDPIARAALDMHEAAGWSLEEVLIAAAEVWSQRCREANLERLDARVRLPLPPLVLVTPQADIERIRARLKVTS